MRALDCAYLGRVAYADAAALQERLVAARREGRTGDRLLLLEHPPVITLGRGASDRHVLLSDREREARGIEIHRTGRGGDVTYHGPGQLVGYPILALEGARRDAHRYLRDLEGGLIRATAAFGIEARRVPGRTGVWAGEAKVAAIGVRIGAGWITSHGFALNVGREVSGFDAIVPCGLAGCRVTSLSLLRGREIAVEEAAGVVAEAVASALGYAASGLRAIA